MITDATRNYLRGRKLLVEALVALSTNAKLATADDAEYLRGEIGLYLRQTPAFGTDREDAADNATNSRTDALGQ